MTERLTLLLPFHFSPYMNTIWCQILKILIDCGEVLYRRLKNKLGIIVKGSFSSSTFLWLYYLHSSVYHVSEIFQLVLFFFLIKKIQILVLTISIMRTFFFILFHLQIKVLTFPIAFILSSEKPNIWSILFEWLTLQIALNFEFCPLPHHETFSHSMNCFYCFYLSPSQVVQVSGSICTQFST